VQNPLHVRYRASCSTAQFPARRAGSNDVLLNEYQIISVPGVGKAKWQHIELLHKLQAGEGLTLANKLTSQHIAYQTQKMKVRRAVQVISASTATALKFLRTNKYAGFDETLATEHYWIKYTDYVTC
jgi:hypothetical protein